MISVFSGFSGSGKSYNAAKLSKYLNCPYLSSDKIRKELSNISYTQKVFENFGEGIYSAQFTHKTYEELIKRALQFSKSNEHVIIDATFSTLESQKMLIDKIKDFIFIFCFANDTVIKERLAKRITDKSSVSDGRWEIYLKQKENFKGFLIPEEKIFKVDTSEKNCFEKILNKVLHNQL